MLSLSIFRFRRRYLVFLVFAAVLTILVSRFSVAANWEHTKRLDLYSKDGYKQTPIKAPPPEDKKSSYKAGKPVPPLEEESIITSSHTDPSVPPAVVSHEDIPPPTQVVQDNGLAESRIHPVAPPSRQELPAFDAAPTVIHWEKQAEHFPVPTESIIKLPTGVPVPIPRIQYAFTDETPDAKITRQNRLSKVREEFKKSWTGYRTNAWMHDELTPTSGNFRDPFCGWAATLVDSLDTLWIMGLEEEFEEAAKAVDDIDFTTSPRQDIPMFETTIRYLGGLLGAYDVSGKKYKNLLSKAEELAEILIGAFDTPNRMPILGYDWKPTFASQPHRASQRSNLAELGSMSLEFTRLAQLTKDPRYYDAVARVTIALAEFQDRTKLPGVFPPAVDASGCNRTAPIVPKVSPVEQPQGYKPSTPKKVTEPTKGQIAGWDENRESGVSKRGFGELEGTVIIPMEREGSGILNRRAPQTNPISGLPLDLPKAKADIGKSLEGWDCPAQGLTSSEFSGADRFSMGGNQDSTYEYLPKVCNPSRCRSTWS
jgi:mannosyl-oligosaccharide alpha-1,2-mannosidase